jgi:hypothetical protein
VAASGSPVQRHHHIDPLFLTNHNILMDGNILLRCNILRCNVLSHADERLLTCVVQLLLRIAESQCW